MRSNDLRRVFRQVLSISLLAPAVATGAAACSGATIDNGQGGDGGVAGDGSIKQDSAVADGSSGTCDPPNSPRWNKPGCNRPADVCFTPGTPEPACYTVVCGCSGKVIAGCSSFTEPYVNLPGSFGPNQPFPEVGSACDPNPPQDAGSPDGCVNTPQPVEDAGAGCVGWDVPLPCSFPDDASSVTQQMCLSYCGSNAMWCSKNPTGGTLHCDPGCAIGRRPDGFVTSRRSGDASSITGIYFAAMAELEAASVFAFEHLARELEAHGAPMELRRRALRAAEDEKRHTRVACALARRFGADPCLPLASASEIRSLEAMALENATEGCIRETFGALTATLQAERAHDPRIKAAMRKIAVDETAHATLAADVAAWLETRLSDAERTRVHAAKERAIVELRDELCRPQPDVLRDLSGLPNAAEAQRMLDGMTQVLWAA